MQFISITHSLFPSPWLLVPFVALLIMIATGPLFFTRLWHNYYSVIAVSIGLIIAGYYLFNAHEPGIVVETFMEYVSFISLLFGLYVAAGSIYLFVDMESKVWVNILFLLIGALLTNIIGTTGASVVLIRPFMRLNRYRLKTYHIVFFIFMVSNAGGLLTPIGDPPLFMGFLKGVPFFWPLQHLLPYWVIAMVGLSVVFYILEKRNTHLDDIDVSTHYTNKIIIKGKENILWLVIIVLAVFLDPNIIEGFPCIVYHGKKLSYLRELIQLGAAAMCIYRADKQVWQINEFTFAPIKEVAFLFFGIFLSMIPALQLLESWGSSGSAMLSKGAVYLGTGVCSSLLDNAPTYINFFTMVLAQLGWSVSDSQDVHAFLMSEHAAYLAAVSVASVFFGAMTYIGNGPNFMVKAIAEQSGVRMPSFFEYIYKYALPYLAPVLVLIWLVFFL